jgi:hypothetical protein
VARKIAKAFTVQPPDPDQYKGRPLRVFLVDSVKWLRQFVGAMAEPGGLVADSLILTTSTITARSGATMGTGSASLVVIGDGGTLSTTDTVTVRNYAGASFATGKYGFARRVAGFWVIISVEC